MGCWNHTCAITNLPIFAGEEIEVILLRSNQTNSEPSYCYPDAYHSPIPLTFSGVYNEYGSAEDCHGIALDTIVSTVKDRLFEMEVGENEYHDIPAKKDEFDIAKLFELDHEGRLFITHTKMQHDMRECVRVKHIVVRKEVYDGIINGMTFDIWDRENGCTIELTYNDLLLDCERFTKDMDDILTLEPDDFRSRYWMMDNKIGDSRVGEMLAYRSMGAFEMRSLISVVEVLFDLRKSGHEDYEAMLNNALRLSMLTIFMDGARKSWHVPPGVGSQDQETKYQELCARLTVSAAKTVNSFYDDEWEE